jgi:limonene-1,2-epoxide hydrolase
MAPLTPGDAQDLLALWKRGVERRSPDELLELFDPDIDHRPDPFSESTIGLNGVHARLNAFAASQANVEFDAERIFVSGNTVLASWHGAYTRRATAERMRVRGFMTLELSGERKIRRFRQWVAERAVGTDRTFDAERPEEG